MHSLIIDGIHQSSEQSRPICGVLVGSEAIKVTQSFFCELPPRRILPMAQEMFDQKTYFYTLHGWFLVETLVA
jgi:hypothetical protein